MARNSPTWPSQVLVTVWSKLGVFPSSNSYWSIWLLWWHLIGQHGKGAGSYLRRWCCMWLACEFRSEQVSVFVLEECFFLPWADKQANNCIFFVWPSVQSSQQINRKFENVPGWEIRVHGLLVFLIFVFIFKHSLSFHKLKPTIINSKNETYIKISSMLSVLENRNQ